MLAEIGADKVPELIVINKADVADPMVIARLRQREPHSVVVSAKTGEGIDDVLRVVEDELPRPGVEFEALRALRPRRPASTGSTSTARSTRMEHTGDGTLVRGRANEALAGELASVRRSSRAHPAGRSTSEPDRVRVEGLSLLGRTSMHAR